MGAVLRLSNLDFEKQRKDRNFNLALLQVTNVQFDQKGSGVSMKGIRVEGRRCGHS